MRPTLIDLYCGAGGASAGYVRAGFQVIGVDIEPMSNYPFDFILADALEYLDMLRRHGVPSYVAAFHASPPCQKYSTLSKHYRTDRIDTYPELIEPTRDKLDKLRLPYVIENIPGAPLIDPVTLCGSHFDLTSRWPDFGKVGLRRHRGFEAHGFTLADPGAHDHSYRAVPVYGYTNNRLYRGKGFRGESFNELRKTVMDIDWMEHEELNEALPPAYCNYVGGYMLASINNRYGLAA